MAASHRSSDPESAGTGKDGGNGGNGKGRERRTGVDRRISDTSGFTGPDRRRGPRRKLDRLPDKPIRR